MSDEAMERAWWRCRAQIAAGLWQAMAGNGTTVAELAAMTEMKPRRVRAILMGNALTVSPFEIFALGWALGGTWSIRLEPAAVTLAAQEPPDAE